ncbi:calcium/sodium antiporter [Halobaculum sp. CBA1158]|uniref:calcium/sodium antiporter n=1 Tax=Halobaculum sp. CBA1158 TaxID=2904243 RepID=UPI001F211D4F|nr:calcium/sodium antiporter [Halobaculum sp. CBA1158]UIP00678.1 calcium/sodium antiporter [Halobaculum sp. CBA1158]
MISGGPAVQFVVVAIAVVGLWIGARLLVDAVVRLARRVGLSDLTVGLTVVAIGTSTPELSVTIDAALKGLGDIAVGNVLGSNVYNLAFILGVVSLLRVIPIAESLVCRDGLALLASTALGGAVLLDLAVSRTEGAALLAAFVVYTAYLLHTGTTPGDGSGEDASGGDDSARVTRDVTERVAFRGRDVALLVVGLAVVLVSGDALVAAASALARGAGVSDWVIGGTIVAAGTSTPEFAVSLVALRRGSLGVSVGNVIGSNVFNLVGVVGIAALVRPLTVSPAALETLAWLAVVSLVMVAALWTGRVLSRSEGALFVGSEVARWTLGLLGRFG